MSVLINKVDACYRGFLKMFKYTYEQQTANGTIEGIVREVVERGPAASVLAFDPNTFEVCLLKQVRPGVLDTENPYCIELIAGMIDKGETPEQAIVREAKEEAGLILDEAQLIKVADGLYPSPGTCTERVSVYIAWADLSELPSHGGSPEENEYIEILKVHVNEVAKLIESKEVRDAATFIAYQYLMVKLQHQ